MTLLSLIDIEKQYDIKKILDGVSFSINEGDRVALIGKNGAGKSTIMKIVSGDEVADSGERIVTGGIQIKMLPQNPKFQEGLSVRQAIESQLVEIQKNLKEFYEISNRLQEDYENRELLERQAKLSNYLDHHSAWNLDDKIERVLEEFKLKEMENRSVNTLSGGELRRVALAGLLLQKPDILLLDEPTNHLDVYMVEFLENLILKERYTLLFISHDRYFIDRVGTRTIEIENGKIMEFKGGYQNYLQQKEEHIRTLQKQHENLLKLLKQENEWFSRGVKARLKRNEGRKARLMELREKAKKNPALIRKMQLELEREKKHFQQEKSVNRQKVLFELENINKKLGNRVLISNFSYRIVQKDRLAIVGRNGTGKSTLLKILVGKMEVDSGKVKRGEIRIGYFDQHREGLDDSKNLIETFCPHGGDRVNVRGKNMHVYGYLKQFLFPKEFLDKKIGVLSGGEKNRVALALLFTKDIDVLILDEPTNDLDIATINILEEQLQNFAGAVIIVSHDRYFVDKVAKKLLIFKGNGVIEESYQPYSEYLEVEKFEKEIEELSQPEKREPEKEREKRRNSSKRLSYKEKRILEEYPKQIEDMEEKMEELQTCLATPECYEKRGIVSLSEELEELQKKYDEMVDILLEIEEKAEELRNI
ncbi:MAG TPA: ABC transporter ATP-binding protein [Campylobacterales bacterium]|nr:ABC transporter ATP-binding protein [Campylobacterales bacterium]